MPRLMPSLKRDDPLMVATQTIYPTRSDSLRPWIGRGEVLPRSDPKVKSRPEAFEEAPTGVLRGLAPRPDEAASIASVTFTAFDGKWVWASTRLHPCDEIVRAHPQFFYTELPRD